MEVSAERTLPLDSDCDSSCSCVDNACACESQELDMSFESDAQTTPPLQFADDERGKTNSGCALSTSEPKAWLLGLALVLGFFRKRKPAA